MVKTIFGLFDFFGLDIALAVAALMMGALSLAFYYRARRDRQQILGALNNMSQGLCMFDENTRLAVFNDRYIEMYRMSPKVVRLGCSLRDILQHRIATGTSSSDPDRYIEKVLEEVNRLNQVSPRNSHLDKVLLLYLPRLFY